MFMQAEGQTGTINPVFAGYAAQQLQEATGGIDRVFDNLLEIARGNDPDANGYDRLRATRVLYDRGMGKVTKNTPRTPPQGSERPPKSEESNNHTNHSSDNTRPVARLEQKLNDALGPPQAPTQQQAGDPPPIRLDEPGHVSDAPGYTPDLVREAQYYVLEITDYGDKLASILAYIHEPDPDDTSIRPCHRIAAGRMILDRVLGAVADLEQPLDHWHDPSLEPNWGYKHPAEIDSSIPLEKIIEADRFARDLIEGIRKEREAFQPREETGPCHECRDDYPCEYHEMAEELTQSEEELLMTARGMRNLGIFRDRLYFDEHGLLRLRPPPHIDDS